MIDYSRIAFVTEHESFSLHDDYFVLLIVAEEESVAEVPGSVGTLCGRSHHCQ